MALSITWDCPGCDQKVTATRAWYKGRAPDLCGMCAHEYAQARKRYFQVFYERDTFIRYFQGLCGVFGHTVRPLVVKEEFPPEKGGIHG